VPFGHFTALLGLRIINAFLLRTFYVPDEHWQSLEVAHRAVFGYGYLTWEWEKRIRGFLHPLLFFLPYSFLRYLRLDSRSAVIAGPKIVQACLAAIGDFFFFRFAKRVVGVDAAKWASFAYLTNYFALFSLPRTLSNSLETIISVIALSYFPFPDDHHDDEHGRKGQTDGPKNEKLKENQDILKHLSIAALSVVVRPTAVITWIPLWLPFLLSKNINRDEKLKFCTQLVLVALVAILASTALDSLYYGQFTFVPWEFVKWNVFEGVASFYGSHPFHWYFTQGFPVILGPHLLPFLFALRLVWQQRFSSPVDQSFRYREMQKKKEQRQKTLQAKPTWAEGNANETDVSESRNDFLITTMTFCIIFIYSFLGHKEFRFIFTTLPLAMCLVGKYYASLESDPTSGVRLKKAVMIGIVTLVNFPIFIYLAMYHQRGNLDVFHHLGDRLDDMDPKKRTGLFILFLLPCHQHPYYSHLHHDLPMRFLHCEPWFAAPSNLNGASSSHPSPETYIDEADQFFSQPEIWLKDFLSKGLLPSHVIVSRKTDFFIERMLKNMSFSRTREFFHSHLEMDSRMGTELLLYERT